MKTLIGAFALLGLTTAVAYAADDAPAPAPTEADKPAEQDCTKLEGDAKTQCEEAKKAAEPKEEDKKAGKSLNKSENNRMEAFDDE